MTPLEKFNLMIQGGYNPMGGGINTNQMNDFIAAGFRKPFDNKPVMQNLFNTQQFSQNVEDKKQADQRLKNQQLGNFLLAFSDTLRGVNPAQGVLQRQELFQQQADKRKQEESLAGFKEAIKGTEFENFANAIGDENAQKLYSQVLVNRLTAKPDKLPASIEEYEFAKSQGFQGSLIDFINNKNPGDTFNLGNTRDVEIIKSRIELGQRDIEETKKSLRTTQELLPRLTAAQRILKADDFQTGPLVEATLGIRKLYSDITGVEVPGLDNQQAFDAFTKFTIPRMRPPGSGATSDFEANLFEQSTASLGKTKKANQIIIGTMLQTARREQELSMLKEEFFANNNTTIGFDKYIKDNNLMPRLYLDITSSDQAIDLFDNQLLRDGDVYIDFITDPNNPQLAVFDKRDIR